MSYQITSTGTGVVLSNPTLQNPATVVSGAYVTNTTTVHSGDAIYGTSGVAWTLSNYGTIKAASTGAFGVELLGSASTVNNFGTIEATGTSGEGIQLRAGGSVANSATTALISGSSYGVFIGGTLGEVTNSGTIEGTGTAGIGVWLAFSASTLVNAGTITGAGGTAVEFSGGGNRLIVDPGASFADQVVNGGAFTGSNTLELASAAGTGTLSGLGASFIDFGGLAVNTGAVWLLSGTNTFGAGLISASLANLGTLEDGGTFTVNASVSNSGVIDIESGAALRLFAGGGGAGTIAFNGSFDILQIGSSGAPATLANQITGFTISDTIDMGGLVANGDTYAGGVLTLTNGATVVADLTLSTPVVNPVFTLGGDGSGGTLITVAPQTGTIFSGSITTGIYLYNPALQNPATIASGANVTNTTAAHGGDAVYGTSTTAWTVDNFGVVNGGTAVGVYLARGGIVTNASSGLIEGAMFGVKIAGAPGSVVNLGSIASSSDTGVWFGVGGTVDNGASGAATATISGSVDGIFITGGAGSVVNFATVTGGSDDGVCLYLGGAVSNGASAAASGLIEGYAFGVEIRGSAGTVTNFATITGTGTSSAGVALYAGGLVTNGTFGSATALIQGIADGVEVIGSAGTLANFATITGTGTSSTGVSFGLGGAVTNNVGGVISAGLAGVQIIGGGGTVVNRGSIAATGTSFPEAVYLAAGGSVANYGSITALGGSNGVAVNLALGGTIRNPLGGLLQGSADAVVISGAFGSVANYGQVAGGTDGIVLKSAGDSVTNFGTIVGTASYGVYLYAGGVATNRSGGLIEGKYEGVLATHSAGTVVNFGAIDGIGTNGFGIHFAVSGSTLTNAGSITGAGGTAVEFAGGGNRLILAPGASFGGGIVSGGTGSDTLELAAGTTVGAGTLAGLGTEYLGFTTLTFDRYAQWLATGGTAGFGTAAITGFASGDTIDLTGVVANGDTYSGGVLTLTNGATVVAALTLSTPITNPVFTLGSDGHGGTLIEVAPTSGKAAFMTGSTDPWPTRFTATDPGSPESAMNSAFGVGGWTKFQGFTTTPLTSGYKFVLIDGGNGQSGHFDSFINANRSTLEAFVNGGGRLFINAARWTYLDVGYTNLNLGFGATLEDGRYSNTGTAVDVTNPIFTGPVGTAGTSWTGDHFSHDIVVGAGLHSVITGSYGVNLAGEHYGAGYVMFGGITAPFFHSPQPQSDNLYANTLDFVAGGGGTVQPPGTLSGQEVLSAATEHVALLPTTAVATFSDSNTSDTASGFTASIDWGDGTTTAGTVSGGGGAFTVSGGHSFADEGSPVIGVTLTRIADGAIATASGTVTVGENDLLSGTGTTFSAISGQSFGGTVANFTDSDTVTASGDLAATIDWGDGATTAGTVSGGSGTFAVSGLHTFSTAGQDTVTVTLSDDPPGTATATATSTGTISGGLSGHEVLSAATEHVALAGTTPVATFSDGDTSEVASGFTATIDWGDGTTTAGTVSGGGGTFTVSGGHSFADEGSPVVGVTLTRIADGATATASGTVTVGENDNLSGTGLTFSALPGQSFSGTVANFTDSDTVTAAGDLTASIDWGDGTTTAGTVSGGNGTFAVSGVHTFGAAGRHSVTVTLSDDAPGTATASATSTASGGITFTGTYVNGIVLGPGDNPATIAGTAYVTNHGTALFGPAGTGWTVANYGLVNGAGGGGVGIDLASGGVIDNGAPGLLARPQAKPGHGRKHRHRHHQPPPGLAAPADGATITGYSDGVAIGGAAGSVTNFGTISAAGRSGIAVYLAAGGLVTNGASGAGGLIGGASGIVINGGPGTVDNFGTVAGSGGTAIALGAAGGLIVANPGAVFVGNVTGGGGTLELAAGASGGTLTGLGSQFLGFARVTVDGGAVWSLAGDNRLAAGTVLFDGGASLEIASGATLVNAGTLDGGGGTALSFAGTGSRLVADPGAVFRGTVAGGGNALELAAGGGEGTLSGLGKSILGFATVTVDPGALWQISDKPADPPDFVNDGTIIVSKSLSFGALSADRGQQGTIDLGNNGVAETTGVADARLSFVFTDQTGSLRIDQPSLFHAAIGGFQPGDTIDLVGTAADGFSYSDGFLTVSEAGATVATLSFSDNLTAANFTLGSDGQGGTVIGAVLPKVHLFSFQFLYNDAAAYYTGTVADDGSFGYTAGETIAAALGHYTLFRDGATQEASGTVTLSRFFSSPAASTGGTFTPFAVSQNPPDGGVGSESGQILVNGTSVLFSSSLEPSFLRS